MSDLRDGESVEVQGSGSRPYVMKNVGGVYSCTCPAWRNQSVPIERRTCKHLRRLRGDAAEEARLGAAFAAPPPRQGEQREGPPVLLAETWDSETDLAGWWLSEKLDGVRAYWDGKQFLSRNGNVYLAPDWFVAGLPEVPLDGELWIARKAFQRTSGIVRRQDRPAEWRQVRYVVFDAPGHDAAFEERLRFLDELFGGDRPPHLDLLAHQPCRGLDHLRAELQRIDALGGEGLMLRQPGSRYVAGRSSTLLKVKQFLDADATVIGHEPGQGRHKGRLGAVLARLADGTVFAVGTGFSDAERAAPPPIGSVITFRYQELSDRGVPRFPSFVRVRGDGGAVVPAVAAASAAPPVVSAGGVRHFELVEGTSSKFWEVWTEGTTLKTRYGRIGSQGTTTLKQLADEAAAQAAAEKLIREKTGKGYVER